MTWLWVSIYVFTCLASLAAWQIWSRRASRDRALEVLHLLERALYGQGHVTGIRWLSATSFEVPVRLSAPLFQRARFVVHTVAQDFPLAWAVRRWRQRQPETLTFFADLDFRPNFAIEVQTLRSFARSRKDLDTSHPGWTFETAAPVVLTTRLDWQKEVTCAIQSLLGCGERDNINLEFQPRSPNFRATMPLDTIEISSAQPCQLFELLRTVAEGASAKA